MHAHQRKADKKFLENLRRKITFNYYQVKFEINEEKCQKKINGTKLHVSFTKHQTAFILDKGSIAVKDGTVMFKVTIKGKESNDF